MDTQCLFGVFILSSSQPGLHEGSYGLDVGPGVCCTQSFFHQRQCLSEPLIMLIKGFR
jgi:hypothetical protein